jgi:hypothetical protein
MTQTYDGIADFAVLRVSSVHGAHPHFAVFSGGFRLQTFQS